MYWQSTTANDPGVVQMLASHYALYSRHVNPYPPGEHLIFLGQGGGGVFIIHRRKPVERLTWERGYELWTITAFRNESDRVASELVREGLAAARWCWGGALPRDGVQTLVDTEHLTPVMRRGVKAYGFCYIRVGFREEFTDRRLLRRLTLSRDVLARIEPIAPRQHISQAVLF